MQGSSLHNEYLKFNRQCGMLQRWGGNNWGSAGDLFVQLLRGKAGKPLGKKVEQGSPEIQIDDMSPFSDMSSQFLSVIILGVLVVEWYRLNSVQFSCSVMSNSLRPHELQHARPPCPSPTPGVYSNSNSCPSSWWCHPATSSSVVPSPPASNPSQHQGLFQ